VSALLVFMPCLWCGFGSNDGHVVAVCCRRAEIRAKDVFGSSTNRSAGFCVLVLIRGRLAAPPEG